MWLLLLHNEAHPWPTVTITMWVMLELLLRNQTELKHIHMLWISINHHPYDFTQGVTVHIFDIWPLHVHKNTRTVKQVFLVASCWIISINFDFTWQPSAIKTEDFFLVLLRQIGQECCCHLQITFVRKLTQCKHLRPWMEKNEMTWHVYACRIVGM